MERDEKAREWVVKRRLSTDALKEYVKRLAIQRTQVIAITEPEDGVFSLIFEPNEEQQGYLEAEQDQIAETLDEMFGPAVTPVLTEGGEGETPVVVVPSLPAERSEG